MKENFMNELENQINIYDVENKEEILEKYRKRYDFGLESGLSEEEIENMLGTPKDIVSKLVEKEKREKYFGDSDDSYAELLDSYEIDIQTISDDISFVYSKDTEYHVEFQDVDLDYYEIDKTENHLKIRFKKRKFFSSRKNGLILVEIPKDRKLGNVKVSTTSGDILIPLIKTQDFQLNTVSGDCEFDTIEANTMVCSVVSGDIEGKNMKADEIRLDTISGDIEVEYVTCRNLKVDAVSGDVKIDEAEGNISSTSVSGDVIINGEETGRNVKKMIKGIFK